MMIRKTIYMVVSAGILFSCAKSDIEIQKNTDTSWEVDKAIREKDIRERIGFDPRYESVYSEILELDVPMLRLKDFPIIEKNTRQVQVRLSKSIEQDLSVSLAYDANLFEKVKGNYSGYELGEMGLVEITQPTQNLVKGTTSVTFELKISNQNEFDKRVIIPLAIKVANNDLVKTLDKKDYVLVKIAPKEITFKVDEVITKNAYLENGIGKMSNPKVTVNVAVSDQIPTPISLGLIRDNALEKTNALVPDGMEGTIEKVDFQNKTSGKISFDLQNIEALTSTGDYVLPLKLIAYDATGKSYEVLSTPILITVKVNDSAGIPDDNEIEEINSTTDPLLSSTGYRFKSEYQPSHLYKISDGKTNTGNWWIDTKKSDIYLEASFTKLTLVKGIKITQLSPNKKITSMLVAATDSDQSDAYVDQGEYTNTDGRAVNELYIRFKKPIMVKNILFYNFENSKDQYINIHEVEFF